MEQIAEEHSRGAIFAADGKARHRLVRAAVAAGVALLGSWLIALALGVLGGFGSLPGLPASAPMESDAAGRQVQRPPAARSQTPNLRERHVAPSARASTPARVSHIPSSRQPQSSTPKPTSPVPAAPTTSTVAGSASHGRGLGTTKTTTGKPIGSPGNGPGGSGPPGRLR
jgi:hypothetical protein